MTAASLLQVREEENSSALGTPLPLTDHALSVSMPTWRDNVGYMEQDRRVLDALLSGYPRFVVPLNVRKVSDSDSTVPPSHSLTRPYATHVAAEDLRAEVRCTRRTMPSLPEPQDRRTVRRLRHRSLYASGLPRPCPSRALHYLRCSERRPFDS